MFFFLLRNVGVVNTLRYTNNDLGLVKSYAMTFIVGMVCNDWNRNTYFLVNLLYLLNLVLMNLFITAWIWLNIDATWLKLNDIYYWRMEQSNIYKTDSCALIKLINFSLNLITLPKFSELMVIIVERSLILSGVNLIRKEPLNILLC